MIYSMTGFGKATAEYANKKITVTVKTLNSKQFDLSTRIPSYYKEKELELRSALSLALQRGKAELSVNVDIQTPEVGAGTIFNEDVVSGYISQIKQLSKSLDIPEPQNWFELLLRLPGSMLNEQDTASETLSDEESKALLQALHEAIDMLNDFRKQEGVMLEGVLRDNINMIAKLLEHVNEPEQERITLIKQRIEDGLSKLAIEKVDNNRLEQEMIYYIEKLDINEEKNRLRHHLDYFINTIQLEPGQGKKLGFIAQEIGREINTLGSKSNHAEMQQIVVKMKDALEQIKEQVLNVL
ncbi:YicC/YloC family endoribonuclease [Porphyromonas pogonae]|uniref:YicC/YloC family endoribonuclease n=1 Tax=Porphyromonas pogonae TaxID=867595 RepID=UPI002E75ED65|nr:YicC/YloC family endoribonuclease [Porphyromonas pogonae]